MSTIMEHLLRYELKKEKQSHSKTQNELLNAYKCDVSTYKIIDQFLSALSFRFQVLDEEYKRYRWWNIIKPIQNLRKQMLIIDLKLMLLYIRREVSNLNGQ